MFGIGTGEIILILIIGFLLYGPDKLPGIARKMGDIAREWKKTSDQVSSSVRRELEQLKSPDDKKS